MDGNKISKIKLIRDFFGLTGGDALRAFKELPDADRTQLASAIARAQGLDESACDFVHVAY